jgi:hypothetical protein
LSDEIRYHTARWLRTGSPHLGAPGDIVVPSTAKRQPDVGATEAPLRGGPHPGRGGAATIHRQASWSERQWLSIRSL